MVTIIMAGAIISGFNILTSSQDGVAQWFEQDNVVNGFEVHEWGVFCQEYNSNIVNVVTNPLEGPVFARKPVIYFHYDENISDVVVEVDFDGDILVTIPNAIPTESGIGWTIDIVNNSVIAPNGTAYDYLFYECQINVSQGIIAYIVDDGVNVTFYLQNVADYQISDILFIYGYSTNESMWQRGLTYVYIDTLESGEETSMTVPLNDNVSYETSEIFDSLTENGLTDKEAIDLIDYWKQIWFYPTNEGTYAQLLYTIPGEIYDELLPISVTPQPEIINRVGLFFITDIPLNPSAEQQDLTEEHVYSGIGTIHSIKDSETHCYNYYYIVPDPENSDVAIRHLYLVPIFKLPEELEVDGLQVRFKVKPANSYTILIHGLSRSDMLVEVLEVEKMDSV